MNNPYLQVDEKRCKESDSRPSSRTVMPEVAGVIYLLLGMSWLVVGFLQFLGPWLGTNGAGPGGIDLRVLGAWNAAVSVVYLVIGVFLFKRSQRAFDWGLGSALLSMPVLLLTGGLNCIAIPRMLAYAVVIVLLRKSRREFQQPITVPSAISGPFSPLAPLKQQEVVASRNKKALLILASISLGACVILCASLVLAGILGQRYLTSARAFYDRGTSYSEQGDLDRAIIEYTKAIELDPMFASAYNDRATTYDRKGDYGRAIADLDKAIELDPQRSLYYKNRGLANRRKGNLDQAIADGTRAIELDDDYADAYYARGIAYSVTGQHEHAVTDYTRAIELDPKHADAYYNRGLVYLKTGNLDLAIADNTRAIELANFPDAYLNRGVAYEKKGNVDQALADYDKAIQIAPTLTQPYHNRGRLYLDRGKYDKAISDYDKLVELDPQYADAYFERGIAYASKGDLDRAIADFTKTIQLDSTYANAYHNRGGAYRLQGLTPQAISDFETYLWVAPDANDRAEVEEWLRELR